MKFQFLIHELGADDHRLSPAEAAKLDRDGHVDLGSVLSAEQIGDILELAQRYIHEHNTQPEEWDGAYRITDVIDLSPVFDVTWSHPRLIAAADHLLDDEFRPMSVNYRSVVPRKGQQHLHSDNTKTLDGRHSYGQAIIPLVDFTDQNGPTRFVPGTHRASNSPSDEMDDVHGPHPREIRLIGKAGTAFFFDGNLWHSGTTNWSREYRPALHSGFVLRHADNPGLEIQRGTIRGSTYDRLSPAQRNFLDYKVVEDSNGARS